jgi:hypothetical protein
MADMRQSVAELFRRGPGKELANLEDLPGGVNSLVFRAETAGGGEYLVKKFFKRPEDRQCRLETEMAGLRFLWDNGVRCIPEPVYAERPFGLFGFIRGRRLGPGEITRDDLSQAAAFLGRLRDLASAPGAGSQPPAKEACFTLRAYLDIVEGRLEALRAAAEGPEAADLGRFLRGPFAAALARVKDFAAASAARGGPALDDVLPPGERLLSPSDVGFHNLLKGEDGVLYFIDFEYWGWDDPAKTLSDFFLQPQVPIPYNLRQGFFREVHDRLGRDRGLPGRLPPVYLILGLKWCLIMLNGFLRPESREDGAFLEKQLAKAATKLAAVAEDLEEMAFPVSLSGKAE